MPREQPGSLFRLSQDDLPHLLDGNGCEVRVAVDEDGVMDGRRGGDQGIYGGDAGAGGLAQRRSPQGNSLINRQDGGEEWAVVFEEGVHIAFTAERPESRVQFHQAERRKTDYMVRVSQHGGDYLITGFPAKMNDPG